MQQVQGTSSLSERLSCFGIGVEMPSNASFSCMFTTPGHRKSSHKGLT